MYLNIHTQKTTISPQNAGGEIVSTQDNLATMGIYPIAEIQPDQKLFQYSSGWHVLNGYAITQFQDITLEQAKIELKQLLQEKRKELQYSEYGWTDSNGVIWYIDTSLMSQFNIIMAINEGYSGGWKFEYNNTYPNVKFTMVNSVILNDIKNGIKQKTQTLFGIEAIKENEVNNLLTVDECRTYYDNQLYLGWDI